MICKIFKRTTKIGGLTIEAACADHQNNAFSNHQFDYQRYRFGDLVAGANVTIARFNDLVIGTMTTVEMMSLEQHFR